MFTYMYTNTFQCKISNSMSLLFTNGMVIFEIKSKILLKECKNIVRAVFLMTKSSKE